MRTIAKSLFLILAVPAMLQAASAKPGRPATQTSLASMKRTAWGLLTAAQQDDHVAFMAKIAAGATYVDEREGRSEAGPLKPEVLQPFLRNCALFDRGIDEGGGWRLTWQCGIGNYVGVYLYFRGGRVYRAKVENIPLVTTGVLPMQSARFPETVDGD